MIIVDYKDIRTSSFHLLVVKIWVTKHDGLHKNDPWYSFKSANFQQNSAFFNP